VLGSEGVQAKGLRQRRSLQFDHCDADFACGIHALVPDRFAVLAHRNQELRYFHRVVGVHMEFDAHAVRMMGARVILQHVPGRDQEKTPATLGKETGGIGLLFLVEQGCDAGHGKRQRFDHPASPCMMLADDASEAFGRKKFPPAERQDVLRMLCDCWRTLQDPMLASAVPRLRSDEVRTGLLAIAAQRFHPC
jgi:hypothetical protein